MRLTIKTNDTTLEFEMDSEEFDRIMDLRKMYFDDPKKFKDYLMNIEWILRAIEGMFKNAEKY